MALNKKMKLGDMLIAAGKINDRQLEHALRIQTEKNEKLGNVLMDLGYIKEQDLFDVLEMQFDTPTVDLDNIQIDAAAVHLLQEDFCNRNLVFAFKKEGNALSVAMNDPLNLFVIDDMEMITGLKIEPFFASRNVISRGISRYFSKKVVDKAVQEFRREFNVDEQIIDEQAADELNQAPIVRLVNTIIVRAVQERASDIHIEPGEDDLRIRFRTDGEMYEVMRPSLDTHGAIVSRLKIMARMDIAEKRIPQDGRIELTIERMQLDMRVSTIPTVNGEKVVIRIVDRKNFLKTKDELGLSDAHKATFDKLLVSSSGIVLVTGPTGSGKSTTLYAMLEQLNDVSRNVITIEDPVEFRMANVNQVQVNPKANLTFASGLRSMLRQDPDVIMVGEMRDSETAEIAVRAAITGHLVLSTLHTNSAIATIGRLLDMDIPAFLISTSIIGIIAQRLVRKICPYCKAVHQPSGHELMTVGLTGNEQGLQETVFYKGTGCMRCHGSGYYGRVPIHEFLVIDDGMRRLISQKAGIEEMTSYCRKKGFVSLQDSCRSLIFSGKTTFQEYERVVYVIEE